MAGPALAWFNAGMIAAFNPGLLLVPVILVIMAGSFVLIFWAARGQAQKARDRLHAFAQRAGLRVTEKTSLGFTSVQSLDGEQQGRAIRYWTYATGSGKSRTTWVAVSVRVRAAAGLQFDLTRQNFGSKIMEWFGAKDVQVGDEAFDRAWVVKSNRPDFFAAALVPQIRAQFMAAPAGRWGVRYKLEGDLVQYVEVGYLSIPPVLARLEQQLPLLQDLADLADVFAAQQAPAAPGS